MYNYLHTSLAKEYKLGKTKWKCTRKNSGASSIYVTFGTRMGANLPVFLVHWEFAVKELVALQVHKYPSDRNAPPFSRTDFPSNRIAGYPFLDP